MDLKRLPYGSTAVRALSALALLGCAVAAQAAPAITAGCSLDAIAKGSVRYMNLSSGGGGKEINIGLADLASPATGDVSWGTGKPIEFTYDGVSTLTTRVGTSPQVVVSKNVGDLGGLNYLQVTITKNSLSTSIALNNMFVGALPVGSVSATGATCWTVSGLDLGAGFSLTGTLALNGGFGGGASSNVRIDAGYVPPADNEGPVTSDVVVDPDPVLLNGNATVTALVDDSTAGGSTIASAEYSLNGGTWTGMSAIDGTFDTVAEGVEGNFVGTAVGTNLICVRGTDSLGNTGDPTCQSFLVHYRFDGFFSPIDNTLLNSAKAGQSIPAKWRLTDANGVPIDSATTFVGLYSSQNLCEGGLPTDAVEEDAAGDSGLQYIGDGYWQFNWKTPKTYASTCRAMYVVFDSEQTSPVVKFLFKK